MCQPPYSVLFFRKPTRPSLPLRKAPHLSPRLSLLRRERMCQPPYSVLKPLRYKVGGPSEVYASSGAAVFLCGINCRDMGVLLMRLQGHGDCCLWERRDTMQEDYGTTLLIHQQYYTKTDSPHYNTSSDTYQFFGKSYFGSSKPIALHLSKLE